jgi:hypothetical protein
MSETLDLDALLAVLALIACAALALWSVLAGLRDWLFPHLRAPSHTTPDIEIDRPCPRQAGHHGNPTCDGDGD